ncbi:MAG: hypothetical protein RIC87_04190 [Kiloniellales bacterium]
MVQGLVPMLEAEIASIESELEQDVRFQRLKVLQQALLLYKEPYSQKGETNPRPTRASRPNPVKDRVLELAGELIDASEGPVPTSQILEHVERHGVEVSGKQPLHNVSAMLSNSDEFKSQGRSGWVRRHGAEVLLDEYFRQSDSVEDVSSRTLAPSQQESNEDDDIPF